MVFNNVISVTSQTEGEVIDFISAKKKKNNETIKYNKDGSIKKTHCNKLTGIDSEVFPFKTKEDIDKMINKLKENVEKSTSNIKKQQNDRNLLLFGCGINIGLRASDLLTLKYGDVFTKDGNFLEGRKITPIKTSKYNKKVTLFYNNAFKYFMKAYVDKYEIDVDKEKDSYIFSSQKGNKLKVSSFDRIIKETAKEVGISYNVGTHSCRKTYGYHLYHNAVNKSEALSFLQLIFSHSSQKVTMKYIGIQQEELNDFCNTITLGM